MAGVLGFLGFGVAVFALLLVIISSALNDWHLKVDAMSGLWNFCEKDDCEAMTEALAFPDLKTVRGMVLLSMILIAGAVIGGVLKLFMKKESKAITLGICGLLLASGLFLMTGFGIYIQRIYKPAEITGNMDVVKLPDLGGKLSDLGGKLSDVGGKLPGLGNMTKEALDKIQGLLSNIDKRHARDIGGFIKKGLETTKGIVGTGGKKQSSGIVLGSGVACCIVAWLACWLSGVLFFIGEYLGRDETDANRSPPPRAQ